MVWTCIHLILVESSATSIQLHERSSPVWNHSIKHKSENNKNLICVFFNPFWIFVLYVIKKFKSLLLPFPFPCHLDRHPYFSDPFALLSSMIDYSTKACGQTNYTSISSLPICPWNYGKTHLSPKYSSSKGGKITKWASTMHSP